MYSEESIAKLKLNNYKKIISFDESVYEGSICSYLNKYFAEKDIKISHTSFYVTNYDKIPGGNAEYYRDFFGLSFSKIYNLLNQLGPEIEKL